MIKILEFRNCDCGLMIPIAQLKKHKKIKRHAYLLKSPVVGEYRITNQYQRVWRDEFEKIINDDYE
jgi:hypothetical protein